MEAPALASSVDLLGFSLAPSAYEERAGEEMLETVTFTAEVPAADVERFEEAVRTHREADDISYFDVVRRGVSDEAIRVRFGRCLWEALDEGRRHRIHLVTEAYDQADSSVARGWQLDQPWHNRVTEEVIQLRAQVDALLKVLESGGSITADQAEAIRTNEGDYYEGLRRTERSNALSDYSS